MAITPLTKSRLSAVALALTWLTFWLTIVNAGKDMDKGERTIWSLSVVCLIILLIYGYVYYNVNDKENREPAEVEATRAQQTQVQSPLSSEAQAFHAPPPYEVFSPTPA
jgi:hypothetical protein